jgi:general secretion pathway protein G
MTVLGCRRNGVRSKSGFTLIEIMIVLSIIGILSALASVRYMSFVERALIARTIAELRGIAGLIDLESIDDGSLPESLLEVDAAWMRDPWGNPYQYLRLEGDLPPIGRGGPPARGGGGGGGPPAIALARKDRFLVPINSDYDLYSKGPDGQSKAPLQPPVSRDDIIRASDGSFYGVAERF